MLLPPLPPPAETVQIDTQLPAEPALRRRHLPPGLRCIRWHESHKHYRIVSPDGQYRGAFQLSIRYSPTWARQYGRGWWASHPANRWPRQVQDQVALGLFRDWPGAWSTWASCR